MRMVLTKGDEALLLHHVLSGQEPRDGGRRSSLADEAVAVMVMSTAPALRALVMRSAGRQASGSSRFHSLMSSAMLSMRTALLGQCRTLGDEGGASMAVALDLPPLGADASADVRWEPFVIDCGTKGGYQASLLRDGDYGTDLLNQCIDVMADAFVTVRALEAVAVDTVVGYAILSLGIDRGYPRDAVEIATAMGVSYDRERALRQELSAILRDDSARSRMREVAGRWYSAFLMDPGAVPKTIQETQ